MPSEPFWLPVDEVIENNKDVVSETKEPFAVINQNGLEIAIAAPMNRFAFGNITDIVELAVGFLFSLTRNHAFEQGNKRTALISAIQFMEINGLTLDIPDSEEFAELIIAVIEDEMTEREFLEIILPYVLPL